MRVTTFVGISFLVFASLVLSGKAQEGGKPKDQKSVYAELEKIPEKYRAKENPLARDPEATAAGGVLFEEHCQECHGKEALGGKKAPSLRVPEVQQATPGALYYILSNGVVRKGMPVWSKLPEPQRWQLVSYLKSLGVASAEAPHPGKP
ncbi:MAG: c-type cytochrome [Candidatus Acidiferrum sp.]